MDVNIGGDNCSKYIKHIIVGGEDDNEDTVAIDQSIQMLATIMMSVNSSLEHQKHE